MRHLTIKGRAWWEWASIGLLLGLAGCTSNSVSPPPALPQTSAADPAKIAAVKAERETASKVYVLCLNRAARQLDDLRSDPATIARAMLSQCSAEFDQDVKA